MSDDGNRLLATLNLVSMIGTTNIQIITRKETTTMTTGTETTVPLTLMPDLNGLIRIFLLNLRPRHLVYRLLRYRPTGKE